MKPLSIALTAFCFLFDGFGNETCAESLITRFPKDGTWAEYEIKTQVSMPDGKLQNAKGLMTIRMVGTEYDGMTTLRWVEIEKKLNVNKMKMLTVYKFLLPEDEISKKRSSLMQIRKIHVGNGMNTYQTINSGGADSQLLESVGHFFPVPMTNKKSLDDKLVLLKSGQKIKCQGTSGRWKFHRAGIKFVSRYQIYIGEDSPFGSVIFSWNVRQLDGEITEPSVPVTLTLKSYGDGAVSVLPDHQ